MADGPAGDGLPVTEAEAVIVVDVLQAVANQHRLQLLLGLHRGVPRAELVATAPISESGVSNHLRRLEESGLVYYAEDGWMVTPLGVFVASWLEEQIDEVVAAVQQVETAEATAREEFEDVPLSEQERDRAITRRKWKLVQEEVMEILDSDDSDLDGG